MSLMVFISSKESLCSECGEKLADHAWITLVEGKGALCLPCADLDQLVFLPSGNTALTRRATKNSTLSAVVLKWSRARKHYERQGLLVEEAALQQAELECLADADARARRREREAVRREELDQEYIKSFAARLLELFPNCPPGREKVIAEYACQKYSDRVGRSTAAKNLDEKAIILAVTAYIRHTETNYDHLLASGVERLDAREQVKDKIDKILAKWMTNKVI
jgi:hypothetical protein